MHSRTATTSDEEGPGGDPPASVPQAPDRRTQVECRAVDEAWGTGGGHHDQVLTAPQNGWDAPGAAWVRWPLLPTLLMAGVLGSTFALKLHNLGHTGLTRWDEAYHAVVARNVLKHPLKPTLVDAPYLPYDPTNWSGNHVWLHKPILPFWQVALSFAVLGVNTLALRLPAALLSTGAAWLTYLIGRRLIDQHTAVIAATLQAVNPFLVSLVHGYQFADTVDVALLFWVEAGVYCLVRAVRTGAWRDVILAGVFQGFAYLCKSYLAAIVLGLALAAWLLPVCRLARRDDCRIGPLHILGLLAATLLTVAPWVLYCATQYPEEFRHEHAQVWRHLDSDVENWAAPWDRVVFDYLIVIHGVFYTPALVAAAVLLVRTVANRHAGLWLVYAWGAGVVLPHLFAVSKTPSATVIALPAFSLLLGHLISEAWRGERWPLASLTAVLALGVVLPAAVNTPGHGYPNTPEFGGVMRQSLWVVVHVVGALLIALAVITAGAICAGETSGGLADHRLRRATLAFCACALTWLGAQTTGAAWRVTTADVNDPACVDVGRFARDHLPNNAVLLWEGGRGEEHVTTMFYSGRTCYALRPGAADEMAHAVLRAGGVPYLVSSREHPLPAVYVTGRPGRTVYLWNPG